MWPICVPRSQADDQAAGVRVPVRRAETGEGRHEDDTTGVRDGVGDGFDLGRCAEELHVVAQPLHDRAADEDAAFERVCGLLVEAAGERGDEAFGGESECAADVLQQEAAGAVGVLGVAGRDAELAEERGLLIACDAGDVDLAEAERGRDLSDPLARPDDLRQQALREC